MNKKIYVRPTINVVRVSSESDMLAASGPGFKPGVVPPTEGEGGEIEFGSKWNYDWDEYNNTIDD